MMDYKQINKNTYDNKFKFFNQSHAVMLKYKTSLPSNLHLIKLNDPFREIN